MESNKYDYDFFVIGGGPGGNSASKQAAKHHAKVGLADFVQPSPIGTTWGLGGTCVNVGCIPKKMMHFAGTLFDQMKYYPLVGSKEMQKDFNWETLRDNVQNHIASLNFGYKTGLRSGNVKYYNKFAKFIDPHTIELTDKKGKVEKVTADKILIATGLRPAYPDIPGAKEFCVTSDDIFKLNKVPGKTLIIGASYIAIECASFLRSFGFDVTMMVRSILLRGFDRDMADRLKKVLIEDQINFLDKCTPSSFTKGDDGKIKCEYKCSETGETKSEVFDTVLLAIGRRADCTKINIDKTGVKLAKSGKIIVDKYEHTNVDNIYALGDIAEGRPELAPPAIMAGKLLSDRLFGGSKSIVDYENIGTTVYAKIEYGTCGLSEEAANEKFGKENIKVYHSEFVPVEWTFDMDNTDTCYIKVIVNTKDNNKVVGWHILSPHAGEITQGVSVAMKCGLTKDQLDETVGIHPTVAEEMTTLEVTKDMGDGKKTGC